MMWSHSCGRLSSGFIHVEWQSTWYSSSAIFGKGFYFHDRLNSVLPVEEPVLFINLNICGRFWGKIGEFGRNRPETKTLVLGTDILIGS